MLNFVHDPNSSDESENILILHSTEYGTHTHTWTTQTFHELSTFRLHSDMSGNITDNKDCKVNFCFGITKQSPAAD